MIEFNVKAQQLELAVLPEAPAADAIALKVAFDEWRKAPVGSTGVRLGGERKIHGILKVDGEFQILVFFTAS